jgi:outer membrane lipase/esterase
MRDHPRLQSVCGAFSFGLMLAAPFAASAQTLPRQLADFSGLNEIQRPVAIAVQSTCIGLGSLATTTTLTSEQTKLLTSCRKMVQTANALTPDNTQPTGQSLGVSADQLKRAIQAVGHEEVAIQGRSAIETAGNNAIGVRLFALRNGARGFGMTAGGLYGTTQRTTAAALPKGASGGGAATAPAGRLGGFLNINYNSGRKSTSVREDGFDFDNRGATAGIDYRFTDSLVAGVAVSYASTDATIASSLGNADTRSRAISAYGSWYVSNFYVDAQLGYTRNSYDTTRNIVVESQSSIPGFNTAATGSTRGNQWTAVLGAGYDIASGGMTVTPYGRLGYLRLNIDAYTESEPLHGLGLDIGGQSLRSLQTALGAKIAYSMSTQFGVVVPFASVEWNHELANDTRSLTAKYTHDPFNNFFAIPTDDPDRNYASVSLGVSALFRNGFSAFATFNTVEGLRDVRNHGIMAGLRKEF